MELFFIRYQKYGTTFLRISLGSLFFIAGITKLIDLSGIISMVEGMGFPDPFNIYFGVLTMLSELIFGFTLLIGYNMKISVIPLIIITITATFGIHLPNIDQGAMIIVIILLHLVTIAALISLVTSGPGPLSIDSETE